jgi:hypothetical protein
MRLSYFENTERAPRPLTLNRSAGAKPIMTSPHRDDLQPRRNPATVSSDGADTACEARATSRLPLEAADSAISERELFAMCENAVPWSPEGMIYDHDEALREADSLKVTA